MTFLLLIKHEHNMKICDNIKLELLLFTICSLTHSLSTIKKTEFGSGDH